MTLDERILRTCPLVSYEENRNEEGHIILLEETENLELYTGLGYEIAELLNLDGGGSTTVVLREDDGSFGVKNIPGGPPLPIAYEKYDLPYPVSNGETQARAVTDCLLIVATDK